ncbi:alpha/beta fold hydrolase [Microbacterium sp. CPCC 204701]|uniref:alpha/beta fold hydrolase n=1 Tax=Microbacterium sp. CPCC 204701 TaxID=2493084 RepID=UPI000FD99F11|nr:alpha/beta hydrolase [Microbacterium sp. CPCC 204701]
MTETQIFEPDGRAIPYADEGTTGPAVVLVPGRGLNISYLGPLAHALVEEDFRVVRVGPRHPASAADATVSMHDLAQDVVDVMDHIGLAGAWIGGHAFGGSVARTVSLDHPGRVGGVLLLGVEGAEQTDELSAGGSDIPEGARDGEVDAMQRAAQEASPDIQWSSLAPAVPVLVVQGAEDRLTPPANGERLQATAPDRVSVVGVEGAGHLFPVTHVGATAWPIEDYLDWD